MVPRHVGLTTDSFLPLAAYIAPSGTRRASPQEKGFQVSSIFILSNPVSTGCGVYSNRDFLSSSGRLPRAMTIVYTV